MAHIEQATADPLAANWPPPQSEQAFVVAMSKGWYFPVPQLRHTVEDVAAIFPLSHLLQPYMVDSAVFEQKKEGKTINIYMKNNG